MNTAKITEIFTSIQGEGPYVGVKQVFVRFAGCHIDCAWCDTPFKNDPGKEYSAEQLQQEIASLNCVGCHSLSLTGGEPLLQKDFLKEILPVIKRMKFKVYLETNGILYEELTKLISGIDIIAMDFKLPSSAKAGVFWKEHEEFLKIAHRKEVFVKAVISRDTEEEDIRKTVKIMASVDPSILLVLQPNALDGKVVVRKCIQYQKACLKKLSDVRIIPQMHKVLGIR
ncbi:MAG: 7-carboxy-7-deazaguanine synthase QueE [Candidatus Omnitrophica bacterium]|nr:7-carboxy-7-deazaguanine synthase QueE [Candidatus Omnitrophota bacterium]